MSLLSHGFSSYHRPAVRGARGAIAAAHPLAAAAGQVILADGGNAVDAAIAAQAVLATIAPDACSLGGDMLALVAAPDGPIHAVSGTGKAPQRMAAAASDGANSITVPGIVGAWDVLATRWGSVPLARCLAPAIDLARRGFPMSASLGRAVAAQRARLLAGGAGEWTFLHARPGDAVVQPRLAALLEAIGCDGAVAFYRGAGARAVESAVAALGGALDRDDMASHETLTGAAIAIDVGAWTVAVQPPPSQGVLLAMALKARAGLGPLPAGLSDHACIELTEAAFASRADCGLGEALLSHDLAIDLERAARRGGPRAYLHTAGVCVADESALTVSSLVSVFDDFGSGVFVPELGLTLNNRAGGFTDGANAFEPGKRPVHTLAPALMSGSDGLVALSTPGADGQVQTLLQVIEHFANEGSSLERAVAAPRWRSEGGAILIEDGHPGMERLRALGHRLEVLAAGDMRFGAVVAAGRAAGDCFALADWRRECWSGVA